MRFQNLCVFNFITFNVIHLLDIVDCKRKCPFGCTNSKQSHSIHCIQQQSFDSFFLSLSRFEILLSLTVNAQWFSLVFFLCFFFRLASNFGGKCGLKGEKNSSEIGSNCQQMVAFESSFDGRFII